jgi:DNA-binding transcriptional MerR regulator
MKDILETHPVANLKKILKEMKQQVGSYSKMKKAELVARILELKKKGFPVPKVEMYKKPERKKKYKGVSPEPTKKQKEIEKERSRVFDLLEKYPSFKDPPSTRGLQSKHELYTFLIFDAKTIKSLKEVERLIERAGKKEPKKAEPKPKPVTKKPEPKKEKPPFMKLREDIQELKEKLKKSYEKNKNKLSKMTTKKYEDTIKKQLNSFLDDAEEIYDDYNFSISKTNKNDLEKYYFSVVPKKQPK